jgi:hypothetical protein
MVRPSAVRTVAPRHARPRTTRTQSRTRPRHGASTAARCRSPPLRSTRAATDPGSRLPGGGRPAPHRLTGRSAPDRDCGPAVRPHERARTALSRPYARRPGTGVIMVAGSVRLRGRQGSLRARGGRPGDATARHRPHPPDGGGGAVPGAPSPCGAGLPRRSRPSGRRRPPPLSHQGASAWVADAPGYPFRTVHPVLRKERRRSAMS